MSPIYSPRGKAREYSPYALNIYMGCDHRCSYCYAPQATFRPNYFDAEPKPRDSFLRDLEKQLGREKIDQQVLLSFIGDPYGSANEKYGLTRKVLEILLAHRVPVAILTKGGEHCLKDLDIFKKFTNHIKVGASLTFFNPENSLQFEPGAAQPYRRLATLKELHSQGIQTWASLEPVIYPNQALELIAESCRYVDHFKIGKINHNAAYEKAQDWGRFLEDAVRLLRRTGNPFYIKESLQGYNKGVDLAPEEIDQDYLNVTK